MTTDLLLVADEVADALATGRPVVALESTLVTHGLPAPHNLEAARGAEVAIRAGGAVPATIAIHRGRILVGLSDEQLDQLASAADPWKASRHNLAAALGRDGWSGTTVSATMIVARSAGIEVFATGGIGGVHRGGQDSMDVSSDLDELARTAVAVVCAGPKSILDVPRTLEALETRGVPLVGWGTHELAGFFSPTSGLTTSLTVDDAREAAALWRRHRSLGLDSGMLFAVPIPAAAGLPREEIESAIRTAEVDATTAGIHGAAATPWILARVAALTGGRTLAPNLALIANNASVAAALATALTDGRASDGEPHVDGST